MQQPIFSSASVEDGAQPSYPKPACKPKGRNRSSGWTPLVYPASALVEDSPTDRNDPPKINPFFPLHPDVLRASVRELLILNGDIDSDSLKVNPQSTVDMSLRGDQSKKRSASDSADRKPRKRNKKSIALVKEGAVTEQWTGSNSEEVTESVIRRALLVPDRCLNSSVGAKQSLTAAPMPRKVSDVDTLERTGPYMLSTNDLLDRYESQSDISRYIELKARDDQGAFRLVRGAELASMLEVSIVSESLLKASCSKMTSQLLDSFHEKSLRMFLGYKSSALQTDRLRRLFSDFLFDTSHALFAFDQTEKEMLSELPSCSSSGNLDTAICDSLFNDRALRKIGGFDDTSILKHAISIRRLRSAGTSWEKFSSTEEGKRLLHHHRTGDALVAGQQRRGQRVRRAPPAQVSDSSDEEERRSRSSSFASFEEANSNLTSSALRNAPLVEGVLEASNAGMETVTLRKSPGDSWGILLAKEGHYCVVFRTPDDMKDLRAGDIIMTVSNESGEAVSPLLAHNGGGSDCFRRLVALFKRSQVLHVKVRRVAGARRGSEGGEHK